MALLVNIIAEANNIEETRALSLQCMEEIFGEGSQGNSVMLPTALSPSGQHPATHYLCHSDMTQDVLDAINVFAIAHNVQVAVYEGDTKEEFLADMGLTEIV